MKSLRRYHMQDRSYFVTAVTQNRNPILLGDPTIFWACWMIVQPEAWVIMPDHFHVILNIENNDISYIMQNFKLRYALQYRKQGGIGKCWQNRFWDHMIRDQDDLKHHVDYIHYNPVKHGLVKSPFDYAQSSFMEYYRKGLYESNWGVEESIKFTKGYGE